MLPSSRRVNKAYFKEIFHKGSFFQSSNLSLIVLFSPSLAPESRIAFSVSSKVAKSAVQRNKLRRQGYSVVSKLLKNIKPSYLGVFVLKNGATKLDFESYREEIEKLLEKSKII